MNQGGPRSGSERLTVQFVPTRIGRVRIVVIGLSPCLDERYRDGISLCRVGNLGCDVYVRVRPCGIPTIPGIADELSPAHLRTLPDRDHRGDGIILTILGDV